MPYLKPLGKATVGHLDLHIRMLLDWIMDAMELNDYGV